MTSYHYEPLLPPLHQVRLLELLPLREKFTLQESILKSSTCLSIVQLSSPIFCRLHVLSLHEAPSYIALSYAWCQGGGRRNITVDNVRVPVTANLDQALRHLRSQDEPIMLWADALCINQEDVVEKSEQVQRMKEIYERATEVVAWLGPGGEGSDEAMEWIRAFGSKARELRIGSTPALQLRSVCERRRKRNMTGKTPDELNSVPELDIAEAALDAFVKDLEVSFKRRNGVSVVSSLHSLLRRPYWERAWVVQEVTVAGSISFACGTKSVPEESLHYALRLIRNYRLYFLLHGGAENKALLEINPSTAIDLLKVRRTKEISPLIYLIRRLSRFKSTDPRDKVLAFLGISEDSEDLGILSDYSKSTEHVFIQTARALICKGLYEILSMNNSYKRHGNLPSWVPDWSNPLPGNMLQQCATDRSSQLPKLVMQPPFFASGGLAPLEPPRKLPLVNFDTERDLLVYIRIVSKVCRLGRKWGEHHNVGEWLKDLHGLTGLRKDCCAENSMVDLRTVYKTAVADQALRRGRAKDRLSRIVVNQLIEQIGDLTSVNIDNLDLVELGLGDYEQQLKVTALKRRPALTTSGSIGLVPERTEREDSICIVRGASVPYILRREGSKMRLVGEAFISGIMDGEVLMADGIVGVDDHWEWVAVL